MKSFDSGKIIHDPDKHTLSLFNLFELRITLLQFNFVSKKDALETQIEQKSCERENYYLSVYTKCQLDLGVTC